MKEWEEKARIVSVFRTQNGHSKKKPVIHYTDKQIKNRRKRRILFAGAFLAVLVIGGISLLHEISYQRYVRYYLKDMISNKECLILKDAPLGFQLESTYHTISTDYNGNRSEQWKVDMKLSNLSSETYEIDLNSLRVERQVEKEWYFAKLDFLRLKEGQNKSMIKTAAQEEEELLNFVADKGAPVNRTLKKKENRISLLPEETVTLTFSIQKPSTWNTSIKPATSDKFWYGRYRILLEWEEKEIDASPLNGEEYAYIAYEFDFKE